MPDPGSHWEPTRLEHAHRRTGPGGLTPEQLALADDLHTRALAWARAKIQAEIERAEDFAAQATAATHFETAGHWNGLARHLRRAFLGGDGCVMGRFDERLPALHRNAGDTR